jgi:dTDP-glucose 4,6-dehydratase
MLLITGGAGFIGAHFIIDWLAAHDESVINLDALTYAGNLNNLSSVQNDNRYQFVHGNICDRELLKQLLIKYHPRAIIHFAAESHVDRSICDSTIFIKTNIEGTFTLLQAAHEYYNTLNTQDRASFRFLHISTDEVYGSLSPSDPAFTENTPYQPNSPYSASKAASDHLARAWYHTYDLPIIITHCSNNYGPFQFPEKLIPLMIMRALAGQNLPIYGDGLNIRDWLYVGDHCTALRRVLEAGKLGETYNIGGHNEMTNSDLVKTICRLLDELYPDSAGKYERLITYVQDRPGHDRRYAINIRKIYNELGWRPAETFDSGIRKTILWYLQTMKTEILI